MPILQRFNSITPLTTTLLLMTLSACSLDAKLASPQQIADATVNEPASAGLSLSWRAPELSASSYRILFYGYDRVYYRLSALQAPAPEQSPSYRLLLDINYGARQMREYHIQNGNTALPLSHNRHEIVRCGIFDDLTSACLFRDQAYVELSQADLDAAIGKGLTVLLKSEHNQYPVF